MKLSDVIQELSQVINPEDISKWLKTPNSAFNNEIPLSLIEKGDTEKIQAMIYYLNSGICS